MTIKNRITKQILFLTLIILVTSNSKTKITDLFDSLYTKEIYSGFLNTDIEGNELFYIFTPSQSETPEKDPIIVWLNGGPFCSSLFGLLTEVGPVIADFFTGSFEYNEYAWNKNANLLVFEFPSGLGFSHTSDKNQTWNDTKTSKSNLYALKNFFTLFPEYKNNDFYLSGESYAGVYIPFLAQAIIEDGKNINLKGLLIVNGVGDFSTDAEKSIYDFAYYHGIIPQEDYERFNRNCPIFHDFESNDGRNVTHECNEIQKKMLKYFNGIDIYGIYRKCPLKPLNLTNYKNYENSYKKMILKSMKNNKIDNYNNEPEIEFDVPVCSDDFTMDNFLNNKTTQKKLNVTKEGKWTQCANEFYNKYNRTDSFDFYKNFYPKHTDLQIWFFSGATDGVINTLGTMRWINKLNWDIKTEWKQWKNSEKQIGGHFQQYSNGFTIFTFKNAGHMVPQDMRKEAKLMFDYFLKNNLPE